MGDYLDKPDQIRIAGKGTIVIVYSADGEKLKRTFTPEGTGTTTVLTYINQFVYQSINGGADSLSYINFEEGRIRVMKPLSQNNGYDALTESGNMTLPNSASGVYDYYVTDYQENVRMILTEETHVASNTCTMETSRASAEDPVFGQTGSGNEVEVTRYNKPSGWTNNSSASVSRLGNTAGHNIGPNVLQKVMAGDQVSATVQYYFQSSSGNSGSGFVNNLLSSLLQGISGGSATTSLVKGQASNITTQLNGSSSFISAVTPSGSGGTTPQAWLTILFFDERFNFIAAADGGAAQQQVASTWTTSTAPLGLMNIKAPKNGYVFIYVSNRSDQDVYFDNLAVSITAGNIIEENHYYSFGLKIATICSKKSGDVNEGTLKNNYLYNDKEFFDDGDLDWYDYGFRNYDPQIGRFTQLDPLTDDFPFLTPYQYASDDPINNIDIDGLEGGLSTTAEKAITLETVVINTGKSATTGTIAISKAANQLLYFANVTLKGINVVDDISRTNRIMPVRTDYLGGPFFNAKMQQFQNSPISENGDQTEKILSTSGDLFELAKKSLDLIGKNKLGNNLGTGGNIVSGLSFANNIFNKNFIGAAKDVGEFVISKTPASPYYLGGKLFFAILHSKWALRGAYMATLDEIKFNLEWRDLYKPGSNDYERYQKHLVNAIRTKESIEKQWLENQIPEK